MLDYRIHTFLTLCDTMNYRVTAERMNMTQPAVTQHIKYLEHAYECKLFVYNGKKLKKTHSACILESYARSASYNEILLKQELASSPQKTIRIGATKTIGEYVISDSIEQLLNHPELTVSLIVDNTSHLLRLLESNQLDFALVEGFFDKTKYDSILFRKEPFTGICSKNHPFANRQVSIPELFQEPLFVREPGSGTRAVLEQLLLASNYSLTNFTSQTCLSDFNLITKLVSMGRGISFVYEAISAKCPEIATFQIDSTPILREFNYVYLKNTNAKERIELFVSLKEEQKLILE